MRRDLSWFLVLQVLKVMGLVDGDRDTLLQLRILRDMLLEMEVCAEPTDTTADDGYLHGAKSR